MTENIALRRSLLALAMLGVLLLATGAAWLQSRLAAVRIHAGEEIVQAIRDKGLAKYWGAQERTELMMIDANQKMWGWVLQQRPAEEGYAGREFREIEVPVPGGDVAAQANSGWQLSDDARTGDYSSLVEVGGKRIRTTRIILSKGNVTVRQQTAMGRLKAESSAPANYLPEGTMMLAALLVAQRGADAQFVQIDDNQLIQGSAIRFAPIRMHYQGKLQQKDGSEVYKVLLTYYAGSSHKEKLRLTADGRVVAIEGDGETIRPASEEEVAKHFGKVPGQLLQWPTTAPASTPAESLMGWLDQLFGGN